MSLKERLTEDFKTAMKSKDEIAKNTINLARAAIKQVEVDTRKDLTDEEIIPIIAKQVKMRKDALADFEKGGRTDLIDAYNKEIEVLEVYLPAQLSEDEIKKVVTETAAELGIEGGKQNMGKLMGPVMAKVKGQADGGAVKKIVMEFLG
ncbi:GatB/YqeY domain-containing protein [Gallibacter intestinalis]|uniref:GatB/YqeY domain-containing protein n=1 Tax=Gallibacter intestinalis TaxID=2779356 RepID=A0ABR9QY13_9FIRM|nr:GatB/YqeY domain-containing protein [Gallibacter intestinalis]MBE5035637.1 GatB/YqeY domain-containing protein [Gallibacter intestinalis]